MSDTAGGAGLRLPIAALIGAVGILMGIAATVFYFGGSIKQIEVNSSRLSEIEQHGTGILQTLRGQVQAHDREISDIRRDFRPREFWEALEHRLAAIEAQQRACGCRGDVPPDRH